MYMTGGHIQIWYTVQGDNGKSQIGFVRSGISLRSSEVPDMGLLCEKLWGIPWGIALEA